MTDPTPFDRGMKIESDGHRPRSCRHRAVLLEVESRDVVCRGCGKTLDPFDTLLMYSDMRARAVRRHDDAEEAAEAISELLERGGQITISKRGTIASVTVDGRRTQSSGGGLAESFWDAIVRACRGLRFFPEAKLTLAWPSGS